MKNKTQKRTGLLKFILGEKRRVPGKVAKKPVKKVVKAVKKSGGSGAKKAVKKVVKVAAKKSVKKGVKKVMVKKSVKKTVKVVAKKPVKKNVKQRSAGAKKVKPMVAKKVVKKAVAKQPVKKAIEKVKVAAKKPVVAKKEVKPVVEVVPAELFHEPVLLKEVCDLLELAKKKTVVDATLGLGGHTSAFLEQLPLTSRVIGFDADAGHLELAQKRLGSVHDGRVTFIHSNFVHLSDELKKAKVKSVDVILFDLGIASPHVDDANRGFSFLREGPLDMRFGHNQERTAADIVNKYPEKELARVLYEYGEERQSRRIAREIVKRRKSKPFKTTTELADFIEKLLGRQGRIHPATRVFQALRIEVNEELDVLQQVLQQVLEVLKSRGRVAVISYHSLEDRIVKRFFKELSRAEPARFRLVTKKPVMPTEEEVMRNPRSRSAKLRVAEKV